MAPHSTIQLPPSALSTESQTTAPSPPVTPSVPASDTAAWSLVGLLTFCVICFLWSATILRRRERRVMQPHDSEEDHPTPIDGSPSQNSKPSLSRDPWEREPDWWKE